MASQTFSTVLELLEVEKERGRKNMTFLERWANPQPSKPPVLPEAADTEPGEAGSHSVILAANSPKMQDPTPEERVKDIGTAVPSLKGQAVELWRDGRRFFLVADDEDALEAMQRFSASRGGVWTSGELELVASIPDQATRDVLESFKRQLDGCLSVGAARECVSAAEWQAQILNQMFQEQGVLGQPGKIQPETLKHGMKGKLK